jgi:hypothetical protein
MECAANNIKSCQKLGSGKPNVLGFAEQHNASCIEPKQVARRVAGQKQQLELKELYHSAVRG